MARALLTDGFGRRESVGTNEEVPKAKRNPFQTPKPMGPPQEKLGSVHIKREWVPGLLQKKDGDFVRLQPSEWAHVEGPSQFRRGARGCHHCAEGR